MVRQWQELFYDRSYCGNRPAWVAGFCQTGGSLRRAVGLRARTVDEVEPVIREAFAVNKPVLMDFVVAQKRACIRWYLQEKPFQKCCWV